LGKDEKLEGTFRFSRLAQLIRVNQPAVEFVSPGIESWKIGMSPFS